MRMKALKEVVVCQVGFVGEAAGPIGTMGQWSGTKGLGPIATLPPDLVLWPTVGPFAIFSVLPD